MESFRLIWKVTDFTFHLRIHLRIHSSKNQPPFKFSLPFHFKVRENKIDDVSPHVSDYLNQLYSVLTIRLLRIWGWNVQITDFILESNWFHSGVGWSLFFSSSLWVWYWSEASRERSCFVFFFTTFIISKRTSFLSTRCSSIF